MMKNMFLFLFLPWSKLLLPIFLPLFLFQTNLYFYNYPLSFISSLDFLNLTLICLNIYITVIISFIMKNYKNNHNLFLLFLLLLYFTTLCFLSEKFIHFYFWFESSLIPILFIILGWGYQPERLQATTYLMMYTICASLPLLIIVNQFSHFGLTMHHINFSYYMNFLFLFTILSFLVKLPIYLLHLWLTKAHVEASAPGSMILASILLKLGGYGILRITHKCWNSFCMFKETIMCWTLYGSIVISFFIFRNQDLKIFIALSSVIHMSLVASSSLTSLSLGSLSALIIMIAHGFSSSVLFFMADCIFKRTNSRSLIINSGLHNLLPPMNMFMFIMIVCNLASPPTLNFIAEMKSIISISSFSPYLLIPLSLYVFLGALYSSILYLKTFHGISSVQMRLKPPLTQEFMCFSLHLVPIFTLPLNL